MQIKKLSQLKEKVMSIKLKRRKAATVLMVVLTVLLFVAAVCGLFSVQHIKKVVVKGESPYSLSEIMDAGEIEYDEFLFSKDPDEIEAKILEKLPYIREVKVTRYWFSRLVIKVEADTAHYYMKLTENAKDCFILSKDLRVVDYKSDIDSVDGSGLIYIELPYMDLDTCVLSKPVEYGQADKNAYVKEFLDYFYGQDYAEAITAIGLKSKFEGAYIEFYGKCRIIFGKPDIKNIDNQMRLAYEILEERHVDGDYIGFMKIDVSDGTRAIVSEPESLD